MQLLRRVLKQAPTHGRQRAQLGQRLNGLIDLVVGELVAALLDEGDGLGPGLGRLHFLVLDGRGGEDPRIGSGEFRLELVRVVLEPL